ncbi:sarcocystatin-A-like [Teleopsis dalmanni]|uniref:sarcocystatin-A-like n=1 Tax=Teleopsis dalmanni TaxID=139649 RepID=UPI0018CDBA18|nr:sarcocystatin-A-like [Teleopsis dalmanni]XP_037954938.1 sarcocystatin-A-like [Teleopsis dalmanni]
MKTIFLLSLAIIVVAANDVPVLGGVQNLSGDDINSAKEALELSLTKLAAGEGPSYKLSKILSATSQVVSGIAYKIKAELIDSNDATKICNIGIWSQSWLENGIEVTFECDGEEKLVRKHSA